MSGFSNKTFNFPISSSDIENLLRNIEKETIKNFAKLESPSRHPNIISWRQAYKKFGADPRIVTAMKSHHEDYPYETVEAVIVQTADSISGGRPGARRDSVENYLKRLQELEALVNGFDGVDKSYALQAGREIRVFVKPDVVSDVNARDMARDMAQKIENELKYPGEIKVNLIRELRITEHAR